MGTYSTFSVQVSNLDQTTVLHNYKKYIIKSLRDTFIEAEDALDEFGEHYIRMKWYSYIEDMLSFSKAFPVVIFTVYRKIDGGNVEINYFFDGKRQCANAKLVWDAFDESKLE